MDRFDCIYFIFNIPEFTQSNKIFNSFNDTTIFSTQQSFTQNLWKKWTLITFIPEFLHGEIYKIYGYNVVKCLFKGNLTETDWQVYYNTTMWLPFTN